MPVVSIIGNGRIGAPIRQHLATVPRWSLGRVLVRSPAPDLPEAVTEPSAFFAWPANLIIDAAGPDALRQLGVQSLAHASLWTVGAAALADAGFHDDLLTAASRHGHAVRLFSNGLAAPLPRADALSITVRRPGVGATWGGMLSEAVTHYANELNFAVAAALAGPGLAVTEVTMEDSGPGGEHALYARGRTTFGQWERVIRFDPPGTCPIHPVAAAILEALRRETQPLRFD